MVKSRVVVPVVRGIELPFGVRRLVVTYKLCSVFGTYERRQYFSDSRLAERCYVDSVKSITTSDEFEEVGIYYKFSDDRLHLIERYNTCCGYVKAGEQY